MVDVDDVRPGAALDLQAVVHDRQIEARVAVGIGILIVVMSQRDGGLAVRLGLERIAPLGLELVNVVLRGAGSGTLAVVVLRLGQQAGGAAVLAVGLAQMRHGPELLVGPGADGEVLRPVLDRLHRVAPLFGQDDRLGADLGGGAPVALAVAVVELAGGEEQRAALHRLGRNPVGITGFGAGEVVVRPGKSVAAQRARSLHVFVGRAEVLGAVHEGFVGRKPREVPLVVGPERFGHVGHASEIAAEREIGESAHEVGLAEQVVVLFRRRVDQLVGVGDGSVADADDLEHHLEQRPAFGRVVAGKALESRVERPFLDRQTALAARIRRIGEDIERIAVLVHVQNHRRRHEDIPVARCASGAVAAELPIVDRLKILPRIVIGGKDVLFLDSQIGRHVEVGA